MSETNNPNESERQEESFDFKELFFKCLIRWPWFVASVLACLLCAWLYLQYITPIYNISATVSIKDDKKGGGNVSMLDEFGFVNSSQSIDNEVEVLRSKSLIKDVITELDLYTTYFRTGTFHDEELYKKSPIWVSISEQDAERLSSSVHMELHYSENGNLKVNAEINKKKIEAKFDNLPTVWETEVGTFTFNLDSLCEQMPIELTVDIISPLKLAKNYLSNLTIQPTSKTTSVLNISLRNSNKRRGEDFINKLVEMYNRNANNDKNEVTRKSAEFIDERIKIINKELGSTEEELASFKQSAGLTNLTSDAQLALAENSEYEKRRVENGTQISLVQSLTDYINNPKNDNSAIPANVGINDPQLANLIGRYNEMILERNRLLRASSESNPVVVRLNTSIRDMKAGLQTTINSVQKGLLITKADIERQAGKYAGRISNAPTQERKLVSISRQQEIKAGLYLMLLQKREENAIALAATANNAKIIDNALADDVPVSPKKQLIYLVVLILGISIPIGIIYLLDKLQFKIEGRGDVEKLTRVPVIGEVPLTKEAQHSIAVRENNNDMMAEVFRDIRTNLQFMLADERKVVLFTSTISGEGKTFTAANLAISFALLGKKVIIVGLDIRKPGLDKVFDVNLSKGITQYLASPSTVDLMSYIQESGVNNNLFVLPAGAIPPNPTELLAREALNNAIELLKKHFDYIIIDAAPIGLVTDTKLIARVADATIYMCRAEYTHKADYVLINELQAEGKLPQLCTIINGIDLTKKKYGYSYYGYGKRYGYGYGKRYGYGRKYGYGHENKK